MVNEKEAQILRGYANRLDPNDSGAFNNLGVVFYNKFFYDDAISAFEKALHIDSQNTLARRNLRTALTKSGRYEQFVNDQKELLTNHPSDPKPLQALAEFYKKTGDYDKAAHAFEHALKKNPHIKEVHFQLAEIYTQLSRYSDAIRESLISLQHFPNTAKLHLFLGQAYYNSGMDDTAIEELKKVIELEPASAEAHFFLGFVYGDKGLYEKALEESRKATELNPNYGRVSSNLAIAQASEDEVIATDDQATPESTTFNRHYSLGVAYFNRGLLKEAKSEFLHALEADHDARLIYKNIGEIDLLIGNRKEALTNYLKASIVEPYSAKISNDIGVIYHLDENYIEAFGHYRKALEVSKHYEPARNNLAVLLFQLGLVEQAGSLFSLILYQKEIQQYESYYNYGVALSRATEYDKGIDSLKLAYDMCPSSLLINRMLGITYHDGGQDEKALEAFEATTKLNENDAQSYYYKAIVLNSLRRYQEAILATQKGSSLGPFHSEFYFIMAIESTARREANMVVPSKIIFENEQDLNQIRQWLESDALANIWDNAKPTPTAGATSAQIQEIHTESTNALNIAQAEAAYHQNPTDPEAIANLGNSYMHINDFEKALDLLKKAPINHAEAQRNLGILLVKRRNYIDALQAFYYAATINDQDYRVHVAIGILHEEIGFDDHALRAFKNAVNLKDDCTAALRKMGYILLRKGMLEDAKKMFKALIKAAPNDFEAYTNLAEIFFKTGHYEQAIKVYTVLQQKSSQPGDYQYRLALCNYGRIFQKAIKGWEQVVRTTKDEQERNRAKTQLKYARAQEEKLKLTFK